MSYEWVNQFISFDDVMISLKEVRLIRLINFIMATLYEIKWNEISLNIIKELIESKKMFLQNKQHGIIYCIRYYTHVHNYT